MKKKKTGEVLWNHIQQLARETHGVGEEFVLTKVDLGHPHWQSDKTPFRCQYRINFKEERSYYEGTLVYNPFLETGDADEKEAEKHG